MKCSERHKGVAVAGRERRSATHSSSSIFIYIIYLPNRLEYNSFPPLPLVLNGQAHIVSVHVNFLTKREILKGTDGGNLT
jgi:hypothetical protein